ncbi:MAG: hypothetical protein Q8P48_04880 [Deltaproteobacteria bacterium]|nr:hypothetical protein [Deltaproteobacteria bacterium]
MSLSVYKWGWGCGIKSIAFWGWAMPQAAASGLIPLTVRGRLTAKAALSTEIAASVKGASARRIFNGSSLSSLVHQALRLSRPVAPGGKNGISHATQKAARVSRRQDKPGSVAGESRANDIRQASMPAQAKAVRNKK